MHRQQPRMLMIPRFAKQERRRSRTMRLLGSLCEQWMILASAGSNFQIDNSIVFCRRALPVAIVLGVAGLAGLYFYLNSVYQLVLLQEEAIPSLGMKQIQLQITKIYFLIQWECSNVFVNSTGQMIKSSMLPISIFICQMEIQLITLLTVSVKTNPVNATIYQCISTLKFSSSTCIIEPLSHSTSSYRESTGH